MKLVELQDEMPVFNPEIRIVKEFNAILMRDQGSRGDSQGRKKRQAIKELSFIYFYCAFDSRFDMYSDPKEKIEAIKDTVGLDKDWKPDDLIKAAVRKYKDLMKTRSMGLVEKAQKAVDKLEKFIDAVDLDERTKSNGLVFSPKDLQAVIKELPNTIKSLNDATNIVEKEQQDKHGGKNDKPRSLVEDESFSQIDTNREF